MVRAEAAEVHYHYLDHDTAEQDLLPPVQNTWYTLFDEEDVRLIHHEIIQINDEAAAKDVEARWTIDGNVYLGTINVANLTDVYVFRHTLPSAAGTAGLVILATQYNAGRYVDKRGQSFKVEVRLTGVPGTNQRLRSRAVYETHEQT